MFTVLNIEKRKNSLTEKLFGGFRSDIYCPRLVAVYKGAPFYVLDVQIGKKGINIEKIIVSVGKCARRMVTNCEALLPRADEVGFFKSDELYKRMLENTFLKILEQNIHPKTQVSVCLIDKKGVYTDFAKKLALFSSSFIITTENKEKYLPVLEEIMEATGLCPVLKNDMEKAQIIIDIDKFYMHITEENLKITVEDRCDFVVPEIYNYLKPNSINKYEFYSALYELCGVFVLAEGVFDSVNINNEKKRLTDAHFS